MEHVVFFTGADGASQFRRTADLDEAVRVVEHLRNVEGVEDSRVYALGEVPLTFRTVYRVEVPGADTAEDGPAPLPPFPPVELPALPAEPVAEAPAPPAEDPVPAMAAVPGEPYAAPEPSEPPSNGKPAARGMGFFSR